MERMWKPSTFMRENLKFIHRWLKVIPQALQKRSVINSPSTWIPLPYCGLIFFSVSLWYFSTCHPLPCRRLSSQRMNDGGMVPSSQVASGWSGEEAVISLHRYMTICLGYTISLITFLGWKYPGGKAEMIGNHLDNQVRVTSLLGIGEMMSFNASSASSRVMSHLLSLDNATIFLSGLPPAHGYWI